MDDHEPLEPLELLEAIDACRAGSDDLRDELLSPLVDDLAANPHKRALLETVQHLDAAVIDALEEVPLPAGLQDRLLAALAAANAAEVAAQGDQSMGDPSIGLEGAGDETVPSTSDQAAKPARSAMPGVSRRQLFWTALSVATAASIGGVGLVSSRYWLGQDLSPARVLDEAIAFYAQEVPETLQTKQAPQALPFSSAVSRSARSLGWRRVDNFLGRSNLNGIAFELTNRGSQATLYVVPATISSLKTWPLTSPDTTTAGRSMSVWQGRNVMYVLVVEGGPQAYRGFIRQSGVV